MRLAHAANADQNPWNVFVLEGDNVVNAAATRGNYVFVWTGMLNAAQHDGELATVISHEIGHLLANHTKQTPQEEAGRIMARTTGEIAGQIIASQPGYAPLAQITGILVSELVKAVAVNPQAQQLETEADHIGFFLMADAGYDPHEALSLWSKMANDPQTAGGGLQFLSSHPASADRLEALEALLPEALARYQSALAAHSTRSSAKLTKPPARYRDPYRVQEPSTSPSPTQQRPADEDSFAVH
jgi:predicted Zn-dependent protease